MRLRGFIFACVLIGAAMGAAAAYVATSGAYGTVGLSAPPITNVALYLAILSPLIIVTAFAIATRAGRGLLATSLAISNALNRTGRVRDLDCAVLTDARTGFKELDLALSDAGLMAERVRGMAVDRDLMEFQVRTLERFTLASEVLRDLRTNISTLLGEASRIAGIRAVFYAFSTDGGPCEAEVYWISKPTSEQLRMLRAALVSCSGNTPKEIESIVIGPVEDVYVKPLSVETQRLSLGSPQIEGVVGVLSGREAVAEPAYEVVKSTVLTAVMNVVASSRAINKYNESAEYFATRDLLTGMYNQRMFWEFLKYEVQRARRKGYGFCVLAVDLDGFKDVNAAHGHNIGDQILSEAASHMRPAVRASDIMVRYEGDNFAVLLPQTPQAEGSFVAARIREAFNRWMFTAPDGARIDISASVGMAAYPEDATDMKELFRVAQQRMHKAKLRANKG